MLQHAHAGAWATLNFRWVGLQYPLAVLAMERLLLAASFPAAALLQSWGLAGLVGPALAPFYQMGLLGGLFHALLLPLGPSVQQQVKPGGHVPSWQKRARAIGELPTNPQASLACLHPTETINAVNGCPHILIPKLPIGPKQALPAFIQLNPRMPIAVFPFLPFQSCHPAPRQALPAFIQPTPLMPFMGAPAPCSQASLQPPGKPCLPLPC